MSTADCVLCSSPASGSIWQNRDLRVIDAAEPGFPGFTRVIWNQHVAEMTQLNYVQRQGLMDIVWVVEQTLRAELAPHKINLAQLGNQVPHLHWHIIPRWSLDSHYPESVWAPARARDTARQRAWDALRDELTRQLPDYRAALCRALDSM